MTPTAMLRVALGSFVLAAQLASGQDAEGECVLAVEELAENFLLRLGPCLRLGAGMDDRNVRIGCCSTAEGFLGAAAFSDAGGCFCYQAALDAFEAGLAANTEVSLEFPNFLEGIDFCDIPFFGGTGGNECEEEFAAAGAAAGPVAAEPVIDPAPVDPAPGPAAVLPVVPLVPVADVTDAVVPIGPTVILDTEPVVPVVPVTDAAGVPIDPLVELASPAAPAPVPAPMPEDGTTTAAGADAECTDEAPPGEFNCADQLRFDKCDVEWMITAGFCNRTCSRCGDADAAVEAVEEEDSGPCVDVQPPLPDGNCEKQQEWGKCDAGWIIDGGFCSQTCGRCSDESLTAMSG